MPGKEWNWFVVLIVFISISNKQKSLEFAFLFEWKLKKICFHPKIVILLLQSWQWQQVWNAFALLSLDKTVVWNEIIILIYI